MHALHWHGTCSVTSWHTECRIEMLTVVEARRRFNDGNAACEAALLDLLECQHEDPCYNMLHIELSSSDPAHPCPDVFEAYEASCADVFDPEDNDDV